MSERKSVDIWGVRCSYFINEYRAAADDPTLLLIHGVGGNYLQWPSKLRRMAGVRTVAVDLPGHGDSGGNGAGFVDEYVGWIHGMVEALQLSRLIAVGYSLGGAVAIRYAQSQPVVGLAVIACGSRFELPEGLKDDADTDLNVAIDRLVEASSDHCTTEEMRAILRRSLIECDAGTLRQDIHAGYRFDAEGSVKPIRAPVAIVAGSEDKIAPLATVQKLHHLLPTSECTMIEGASHMLLWENEINVSAAIQSLVQRVETRTS